MGTQALPSSWEGGDSQSQEAGRELAHGAGNWIREVYFRDVGTGAAVRLQGIPLQAAEPLATQEGGQTVRA